MSLVRASQGSPLQVVAGVLRDAAGRILLSQRRPEQDMPGMWEFPGGKREAGESSFVGLRREFKEELGVDVTAMKPLIDVPQTYPNKRVVLETFVISEWSGEVCGREGQAVRWVAPADLSGFAMPSADRPIVAALTQPDRYLISPQHIDRDTFLRALTRALSGGIRRIQLRTPALSDAEMRELAQDAYVLCVEREAELLINSACNNSLALATELGCGIHLSATDLRRLAERPLPASLTLGASCHSAFELQKAERLGCDFAVLGPVAATASHPDALPIGWAGFRALREVVGIPIYALGGMRTEDIDIARRNGAQGIAAIRGLWPSPT